MDIITFIYDNIKWTNYWEVYLWEWNKMVEEWKDKEDRVIVYTDKDVGRLLPEYMLDWKKQQKENIGMNLKRMIAFDMSQELANEIYIIDVDMIIQGKLGDIKKLPGDSLYTNRGSSGGAGGGIYYTKNRRKYRALWDNVLSNPSKAIEDSRQGRDRIWVEKTIKHPCFIQDHLPSYCVSYKKNRELAKKANVVWFHGSPKPHEIGWKMEG